MQVSILVVAPVRSQDPLHDRISNAVVDGFVSTANEELILTDKKKQTCE